MERFGLRALARMPFRRAKVCWPYFVAVLMYIPSLTVLAASLDIQTFPSSPRRAEDCRAVHSHNNNAISRWDTESTKEADRSFKIGSASWSEAYRRITRERSRLWDQLAQNFSNCNQRVAEFQRYEKDVERQREEHSRQARAAQNEARNQQQRTQEEQSRNSQERFTSLNSKYEAAKQGYKDAAAAGRVLTNPRTEIPRVIAERINDVAGLPKPLAQEGSRESAVYSAAHDRLKEATVDAVTRSPGVGAIQDSVADEIKRRNFALVAELDRLDQQIATFKPGGRPPTSNAGTHSGGTLVVRERDQTRSSAANPWAESGIVESPPAARSASKATASHMANPGAQVGQDARAEPSADNPFVDQIEAATLKAASAGLPQSDRIFYRAALGNAAVEFPLDSVPDITRGDRILKGKLACSKDGLGVVISACEKRRRK